MKLNELRENPNNPSKASDEQIERLAGKLKRVPLGLTAMRIAYITDDPDGGKMVISGNKRLRVLKKMYGDDAELPDDYFQDITAMSEAERHEFIVSANVSDGEWDLDRLLEQYDTSELKELMGGDEVDALLRKAYIPDAFNKDPNNIPEVEGTPKSQIGKIYKLGNHRLLCGDSTKMENIDLLLGEKKADLVITDPPYNINYDDGTGKDRPIENDNMSDEDFLEFLTKVYQNIEYGLKDGGCFFVWQADGGPDAEFELALRRTRLRQSTPLVWVKNCATFHLGHMLDFRRRHEVCKYGWKTGASHYFCQDYTLTSLLQDDTPDFDKMKKEEAIELLKSIYGNDIQQSVIHANKPTKSPLHPTMKPVELIEKQILTSSRMGETVLDLFLGSGTTLIASEETGRVCYGIELDQHYCDVIRKRWAEFVNGKDCDWEALTPEVEVLI